MYSVGHPRVPKMEIPVKIKGHIAVFSEPTKDLLRPLIPRPILQMRSRIIRCAQRISDERPLRRLARNSDSRFSVKDRKLLVDRVLNAHRGITCSHIHADMALILENILSLDRGTDGCIVEAGCYKGGSSAKLSIAAKMTNRRLLVFDSFAGLPHDEEPKQILLGGRRCFGKVHIAVSWKK